MQFIIHQTKLEALSEKIKKLAKIATKLKVQAPEAIVRGVQIWPTITKNGQVIKPKVHRAIVEFLGVSPKLEGGWEFMATLEHLNGTNVVRAVPGVTLPEAYQTSKPFCDHCQKTRGRKETFVVKSQAGEVKQVGRACLKDYLGHNALEHIGWLHTFMDEIREFGDDEEASSRISNQIAPIEMLTHAVAVVEAFGFFGREAAAKCDQLPTSDRVLANIWTLTKADKINPTEAHLAKAEEVLAWIGTLSSDSQYNHNLKATALHKFSVTHRDAGLLASAVFSYQKAMGQLAERKAKANQSKHFGTIGNRDTITLTVTKEMNIETAYGILWIFIMQDEAGNVAKWATGSKALESGATYEMKATIKAHTDWKGIAQTELARCKVIKQLQQTTAA